VLATREHVKRTVSAVADGQFALGEKPYWWKGLQGVTKMAYSPRLWLMAIGW